MGGSDDSPRPIAKPLTHWLLAAARCYEVQARTVIWPLRNRQTAEAEHCRIVSGLLPMPVPAPRPPNPDRNLGYCKVCYALCGPDMPPCCLGDTVYLSKYSWTLAGDLSFLSSFFLIGFQMRPAEHLRLLFWTGPRQALEALLEELGLQNFGFQVP
ncbi:hypothetical protein BC828DRAFT_386910 [Blastocladiella britannica]|nr:hypothetical protein BC828DRAFT_386910 [Blastocladiella britannica]